MPIRPIDILMMAPSSQEASILQHAQMQKTEVAQAQLNHLFENELKHKSTQTIKTSKTENNEFRYDAKEKGSNAFYEQGKPKKQNQEREEKEDTENGSSSGFDIKI